MTFLWLWIGWFALFGLIEGRALMNHDPGDTLSEYVWKWLARPGTMLRRMALFALMVWLIVHFLA